LVGAQALAATPVPALPMRATLAVPQDGFVFQEYPARRTWASWEWLLGTVIAVGLPLLIYLTIRENLLHPLVREAELHHWQRLIMRPSILWAVVGSTLLMFRTVLWFFYRPFPPASFEEAPPLTVIIPAYNEGAMVRKSIDSVAASRYPRELLEIIAVDDGSTDDTWKYIQEAAECHGGLVKALRQPRNQGKRAALARGFREARGEVMVTLDSDSVVERDALLAIAGPFRDKHVGAVAGKVVAYNRREGIIPRMLHVRFTVSFDLLRAAESSYGNVFCCPGALTGYRASAVRPLVKRWLKQTFLGSNCTIGEDRAMTNRILGAGFNTVYQGSAVVHTVVPVTYMKMCKMFLRWNRSYVREEVKFMQLVHKRPWRSRAIAFVDRVVTNSRYPFHYLSLILLASLIPGHPWVLVRLLLAVGLFSLLNTLYFLRSERSFDILYGVLFSYFELFAMFWVFPYAVCTVRSRGWLTR
jgi:hyaluronan synthase